MCGIVGIMSQSPVSNVTITEMTDTLTNRGPDANRCYVNDGRNIAIGHTRLSIIDLAETAHQPMNSSDGELTIVFNGEIYNYRALKKELQALNPSYIFKTNSDTEVILCGYKHWGVAICGRLEGMFAFAIYDCKKEEFFLARDRMGKKPLYYYADTDHFVFASEIKALLKYPHVKANVDIDRNALGIFLHLGYIPQPLSAYKQIKKFPSGHYALVRPDFSIELQQYWNVLDHTKNIKVDRAADAKAQLRSLLFDAVEKRLISDVPLGAFLSGGTDSSLITAIASQLKPHLKTFTIGFEESRFDESPFAAQVAGHLETDHQEYILKEKDAISLLDQYIQYFDEPFADTSAIPTMLVSSLAKKEVTVALTGDGGDELFHGYGSYDWANRLDQPVIKIFQPLIAKLLLTFGNDRMKRASYVFKTVPYDQIRSHIFSQEQYLFSHWELADQLLCNPQDSFFSYCDVKTKSLNAATLQSLFDIQYYLKDDLLVKVDRASMFHGLECRSPLLDHNVVEFAMGLHSNLKRKNGERKWILKELLRDFIPDDLVFRPKKGFSVPLAKWMKNDLRDLVEKYLSKEMIGRYSFVRYNHVLALKNRFFGGENFLYNRLWVLIVLHKWLDENS
jgi:asparagine synthase (glutamine-hydrolysing)